MSFLYGTVDGGSVPPNDKAERRIEVAKGASSANPQTVWRSPFWLVRPLQRFVR